MNNEELVDCPYCDATGKYPEWYNPYTQEVEKEDCPACNGFKKCDAELAIHAKLADPFSDI